MDARAKAMQENARPAEIPIVEAVDNTNSDFVGLANALGEAAPQVVAPQVVAPQVIAPQQFDILHLDLKRKHAPHRTHESRVATKTPYAGLL